MNSEKKKYTVYGCVSYGTSIEVEAANEEEAIELAGMADVEDISINNGSDFVWDCAEEYK